MAAAGSFTAGLWRVCNPTGASTLPYLRGKVVIEQKEWQGSVVIVPSEPRGITEGTGWIQELEVLATVGYPIGAMVYGMYGTDKDVPLMTPKRSPPCC